MVLIRRLTELPFFSICIPQYNRTSFLLEACKSMEMQSFRNFEVCISDGGSTDGRVEELVDYLKSSTLSFVYRRYDINLQYDANLRASIDLAQGKYCILHGNDDALANSDILQQLLDEIRQYGAPGVVITNYEDWRTGVITSRIKQNGLVGAGPQIAAAHFRNVSFVGGVILDRLEAQQLATDKWDGSEMYQMYLMARIVAMGKPLLLSERSTVRKDIRVENETVDSYAARPRISPCPLQERILPMTHIGPLVADALAPALTPGNRDKILEKVFQQLYCFTYPFWIIEYRRVQSWKYSLGVCMGIHPKHTFIKIHLSWLYRIRLWALFYIVCFFGLLTPISVFKGLRERLFSYAKTSYT
jgi:glycosyltransferase involved in cell wall biosynthesis